MDGYTSYPYFLLHPHLHSILPYLISYSSSSRQKLCRYCHFFRLSCELIRWLTIAKSQALENFYIGDAGAVEGVIGEGKSVSWGGAWTKGEVHKRKLTKKMFLHSDFLTSLSSSLTQLCFTIRKLALRGNRLKDRELLTNQIIIYTSLTYVKPYQNI